MPKHRASCISELGDYLDDQGMPTQQGVDAWTSGFYRLLHSRVRELGVGREWVAFEAESVANRCEPVAFPVESVAIGRESVAFPVEWVTFEGEWVPF